MKKTPFLLIACVIALIVSTSHASVGVDAGDMTERMMMLVFQLGAALFAARIFSMVFGRLKLPGVLGELVAGMVIGPFALGAIRLPGLPRGLFPVHSGHFPISPELYGLCAVAAIVLLFHTGLETDLRLFLKYSVAGSLVGLGGVVFSFTFGALTASLFSGLLFGHARGFFDPACLFLGVISTATSVGITARILSEKRKLDSPEGVTILGGAVFDDVLGIILLTVVISIVRAEARGGVDWARIGVTTAKAVGVWLTATVIGLLASRRIGLLLKFFRQPSAIATIALGMALILAGVFEEAGLAMIVGAYVMGLSLSNTDIARLITGRLTPIYAFLVPVFFCVMGMLVDFRALASWPVVIFGLVYSFTAILAKVLGGGLPALACGFNLRGALRVGCGMVPRGEVALVVAGIGLAAGVLTPNVFGVAILMTLLTTMISPAALVALFASAAPGTRRPPASGQESTVTHTFATDQIAEFLHGKLLDTFRAEGFYTYQLDPENGVYQLRKDSVTIGLQREGPTLIFDCAEADTAFVNTALYEVVGQLEQTVRALRKPVDLKEIARRVQEPTQAPARRLDIRSYVSPSVLQPDLRASAKFEAIDELLAILNRAGKVKDIAAARKAVLEREEAMSTGIGDGIAIPHGRTNAVDGLVCAVGVSRRGLDFNAIDGQPTHIVVLSLSPESGAAPHLHFMSTIAQTLTPEIRARLPLCETPEQMLAALSNAPRPAASPAAPPPTTPEPEPPPPPPAPSFHLRDFLRPELVTANLAAKTKEEAIDALLGLLTAAGLVKDPPTARETILERERAMSTGIGDGIAIPHARSEAVNSLVCAIGISRSGLAYGSLDGKPAHIIILTLSPRADPAPHIQFMSAVSRALTPATRRRIMAARSAKGIIEAILSPAQP
ncbi:MAG TPA: PTS sugar transporter subunit IIA [Candidatus Brocadiia bacterium]|nr:PTS sugar transporter subunit IIA [Candidatus Brocadiia bacterium]